MTSFAVVLAKKAIFVVLVLSLAVVFYGQPAQALPLVTNGSFEDTTGFVPNFQDTMSLANGSLTMTGWKVISAEIAWIGPNNPFGVTASNAQYFLDLTGYHDVSPFGGVQQTINTVSGQTYLLGFDLGSASLPINTIAIDIVIAGSTPQTFSNTGSNDWDHFTVPFTATGATTQISLTGSQGATYIGLDNVKVEVSGVPLPSTMILLGSGLVGLGLLRRKWSLKK